MLEPTPSPRPTESGAAETTAGWSSAAIDPAPAVDGSGKDVADEFGLLSEPNAPAPPPGRGLRRSLRQWTGQRQGDLGLLAGVLAACLCLAAPLAVVVRSASPVADLGVVPSASVVWEQGDNAQQMLERVFALGRPLEETAGWSRQDADRAVGLACAAAAAFALGGLAAIHSGPLAGVLALLVFASCPGLVRMISERYTLLPGLAAAAVAVSAGVWGLRPWKAKTGVARPAVVALVGGGALGVVALLDGWPGLAAVALPLVLITLTEPGRAARLILIPAMSAVAALVVLSQLPSGPSGAWLRPFTGRFDVASLSRTSDLLAASAAWLGLWVLWTPAALLQAWSTSTRPIRRRRMLAAAAWPTGLLALAFAAPGSAVVFVTLIGAWSVAIAITLRQLHELCAEGRHPRLWRITRWACVSGLVGLTLAAPWMLHAPWRPEAWSGWELPDRSLAVAIGSLLSLSALTLLLILSALRHHPARAAVILAGFSSAAVCLAPVATMAALGGVERRAQAGAAPFATAASASAPASNSEGEAP
ncbi:MAG: hypothetical protein AAF288_01315 [Planctomycetota bacterium]